MRYLGLLLLLTPLVGGVNLLARQTAVPADVVREVVEVPQPVFVPQTVYVTVEVPTVVVVEVPTDSAVASPEPTVADPAEASAPVEEEPVAEGEAAEEPAAPEPAVLARRPVYRPVVRWTPPEPAREPEPEPAEPPVADEPVVEPPAEAPPAEQEDGPTLAARQALSEFYDYTERTWSIHGYSSAAEMRAALGNSQSNWLEETQAAAGAEKTEAPKGGR